MYLLDTNICIYIRRARPPNVAEHFRTIPPDALAMSSVTFAELVYGARKSQAFAENMQRLLALKQRIRVLPFDDAAAEAYGAIRADLERRGQLIGSNDMLIAAHALSLGVTLVTNNTGEFERVTGLSLENWT
ncbi:MAG: type II toxin-antitoxin system VapC family toxin [Sulfuritalea sp.]|nr:type II toxin-antitoxin system VapC family toxin [Sulfuritalea sp.]MDP1982883.1 type II toxin-antitoxin system VapC family toxin [Sulfuritalea sp.]